MTWENLTADADALREELGFERWAVLGHSFGGHVALEYAAPLPRELSLDGAPEGDDPAVGNIGYWAPDGDLVFYYGDIGFWNGIVLIGQFDGEMAGIERQSEDFSVTIDRAE